jgi:hypothetical protein
MATKAEVKRKLLNLSFSLTRKVMEFERMEQRHPIHNDESEELMAIMGRAIKKLIITRNVVFQLIQKADPNYDVHKARKDHEKFYKSPWYTNFMKGEN